MTYSIETITTLIGAHRIGESNARIDWLLTDSRSLTFPEESLFFAIRTQKNDGHRYIGELYRRGVRNFVVSQVPDAPEPDANYRHHGQQWQDHRQGVALPTTLAGFQHHPFTTFLELTDWRAAECLAIV